MGFRVAVALCLSLAIVANAQILGDLAAKENQLNCLLGKPNCVSPSPPPTMSSPPPGTPPSTPPMTPPTESPPMEAPTPGPGSDKGPSPSEEPSMSPSEAPMMSPGSGPAMGPMIPTPAPGPSADGTAVAVVSLSFPDNFVVTDAVRQQLVDLIQQQLGSSATVELQVTGGRKMLQIATFTLLLTDIKDCVSVALILEFFIPGDFITKAQAEGIPLQSASLTAYACTKPGEAPYTISGPPATAPGAVPASGPGSSVTPGSGPSGSAPGSSPSGSAPSTSPSGSAPGSSPSGSPPGTAPGPAPVRR